MSVLVQAHKMLSEEGVPADDTAPRRFDRMMAQLEWWAEAAKAQRAKGVPSWLHGAALRAHL